MKGIDWDTANQKNKPNEWPITHQPHQCCILVIRNTKKSKVTIPAIQTNILKI